MKGYIILTGLFIAAGMGSIYIKGNSEVIDAGKNIDLEIIWTTILGYLMLSIVIESASKLWAEIISTFSDKTEETKEKATMSLRFVLSMAITWTGVSVLQIYTDPSKLNDNAIAAYYMLDTIITIGVLAVGSKGAGEMAKGIKNIMKGK
ncbi:hypothetical protein A3715_17580 [Oleiphilus sp. HI0009]|nr:hypothetical protein A3715_17580 [Oleiphilus sp. HI0009]